jgi:hypothetical protein
MRHEQNKLQLSAFHFVRSCLRAYVPFLN